MDRLDDRAIEGVLENLGYGFLALARDDRPYVIPMSFGFDGARLYFQMNSRGRKHEYIGPGTEAAFSVVRIDETRGRSESVIVEGELSKVPGTGTASALEALAANANFGTDLEVWGVQEPELTLYELRPHTIEGRRFGAN